MGEAGKNVNNWHWTEKDAMPWCRDRLEGTAGQLPAGASCSSCSCALGATPTTGPGTHPPILHPPALLLLPAELLGHADLAPGSGLSVRGTGVKSLEGEAIVNNRKNKIIAGEEIIHCVRGQHCCCIHLGIDLRSGRKRHLAGAVLQ